MADKKIASLVISLKTNLKEFQSQLKGNEKLIKEFANKGGKLLMGLANQWKKVAVVGGAAIAGFLIDVKKVAKAGDDFAKMSKKVGIATETLSAWKHVAELSGTSIDAVSISIKKLSKNMFDFADGTGEAADSFEKLGISVTDSEGNLRNTDELILEIADKFAGMSDGAQKTAMAMELFGRSGADLIPMLNAGSASISEMIKEAHELGIVWSQEDAVAAEEFNDNLLRLQRSFTGINQTIIKDIIPVFTEIFEVLTEYIKANKELISVNVKGYLLDIMETAADLPTAFFSVMSAVKQVTAFIVAMADGVLGLTSAIVNFSRFVPKMNLALTVMGVSARDTVIDINNMREGLKDIGTGLILSADKSSAAALSWAHQAEKIKTTIGYLRAYKKVAGEPTPTPIPEPGEEPGKEIILDILTVGFADKIAAELRKSQAVAATELAILEQQFSSKLLNLDEYWAERKRITEEGAQAEYEALQALLEAEEDPTRRLAIETEIFEQKQEFIQKRIELDRAYTEARRGEAEKLKQIELDLDKQRKELADAEQKRRLMQLEGYQNIAQGMADIFENLYELGGKKNKAMFYAAKAAAMAEATINIAQGMTKALAQGGMLGIAMAGIVAAAGAIQLAKIGSQSLAEGGVVLGVSPSATSDNIPINATAGEFMQPVSAVRYYGKPVMEAMRRSAIPKDMFSGRGITPIMQPSTGFAGGGAVTTNAGMPSIDSQARSEITMINITDPRELDRYLATPQGQNAIINVLSSKSSAVRKILR